jgi:hypothetical protein
MLHGRFGWYNAENQGRVQIATSPLRQGVEQMQGISVKEWFAGMALQGLLCGRQQDLEPADMVEETIASIANRAWEIADAMVSRDSQFQY